MFIVRFEIKYTSTDEFLHIYFINNNFYKKILFANIGRGRENKENERNMEDGVRDGSYSRRGRGGPGRSGRGGRGGGRGLGPRTFANRNDPASGSAHSFNRPIDTWTGEEQQQSNQEPKIGKS